jgi:hypothetical protein
MIAGKEDTSARTEEACTTKGGTWTTSHEKSTLPENGGANKAK